MPQRPRPPWQLPEPDSVWTAVIHPACVCSWESAEPDGFLMIERKPVCVVHRDLPGPKGTNDDDE